MKFKVESRKVDCCEAQDRYEAAEVNSCSKTWCLLTISESKAALEKGIGIRDFKLRPKFMLDGNSCALYDGDQEQERKSRRSHCSTYNLVACQERGISNGNEPENAMCAPLPPNFIIFSHDHAGGCRKRRKLQYLRQNALQPRHAYLSCPFVPVSPST